MLSQLTVDIDIYLQGFSALAFVLLSFIVSIKLLLKYKEYGYKSFLYAGVSWMGITFPWLDVALEFVLYTLFTIEITAPYDLFFSHVFVPIPVFTWGAYFATIKVQKHKKLFLGGLIIQGIIFQLILFLSILVDYRIVGIKVGLLNTELTAPFILYLVSCILFAVITGIWIGINAVRSEVPKVKLKGGFLIIAWITFLVGAALDTGLLLGILNIVFIRVFLGVSSVFFYLGFFLPRSIEKRLLGKSLEDK